MADHRLVPVALYAQLPNSRDYQGQELAIAWEDGFGDWHRHGAMRSGPNPDIEAMALQVARAWAAEARKALDRT